MRDRIALLQEFQMDFFGRVLGCYSADLMYLTFHESGPNVHCTLIAYLSHLQCQMS